jgi:ubiquinone/menaquinone biosynthesis C-methylase UbiE
MTWQNQYQQEGSAAELFQRYVVPRITSLWAKDLVDRACVQAGESVLDVACGTGVVTRLAAEQSGNGRVVGLDLNADMLRVARGVTHVGGISIEWYEGSALALPFKDGAFNIVLCQLGLQFFPDKYLALHEMARVLSFGGSSLVCSHLSSGPRLRMFSRTPSTGISAKAPLPQSVPSTPSRIQSAWRNLLLMQA